MATNLSRVFSAELVGIDAVPIEVETDINVGLHSFSIVGLADKALSEAKERVNAALKNSGVKPPNQENRRIVVNLAPADIKKNGSQYDLAIAIGYLLASGQIKKKSNTKTLFLGELALDGTLRRINGALNTARLASTRSFEEIILPRVNASEAALVSGVTVIPAKNLIEVIRHLEGKGAIIPHPPISFDEEISEKSYYIDEIKGHDAAKRALTIAAAGGHNLLMVGSPGTGKTMLAKALASLLPEPNIEEVVEMTQIWSAANTLGERSHIKTRPVRSPHHTASSAAILGGGTNPRPGEASLAHRGVLFLDELPEFHRDVLEALRQPMESGEVHIARAKQSLIFPARFQLVAAMNPCPCGYHGDEEKACTCGAHEVLRYQKKLSGPLLDRIDLQLYIPRLALSTLRVPSRERSGAQLALAVQVARSRAQVRFIGLKRVMTNSDMSSKQCEERITLDASAEQFLKLVLEKAFLSARGYYRTLKVAQTIADLDGAEKVNKTHLAEAFGYRLREGLQA